jgi:Rab-GTPase-TBC domain
MQEMCRALFIFAKLNPGLTYVQGMNELYAPLYYLCAHESGAGDAEHAGVFLCSQTAGCCFESCTFSRSEPLTLLRHMS